MQAARSTVTSISGGNVVLWHVCPAGRRGMPRWDVETVEARQKGSVAVSAVHRWATSRGLWWSRPRGSRAPACGASTGNGTRRALSQKQTTFRSPLSACAADRGNDQGAGTHERRLPPCVEDAPRLESSIEAMQPVLSPPLRVHRQFADGWEVERPRIANRVEAAR